VASTAPGLDDVAMSIKQHLRHAIDQAYDRHGENATYQVWDAKQAQLGDPFHVRVLPATRDRLVDFGLVDVLQDETLFRIRVSEVAKPKKNDAVTCDGTVYLVTTAHRDGRYGLEWVVGVSKQ